MHATGPSRTPVTFKRHFVPEDKDVFSLVGWKTVDAVITDAKGNVKFKQEGVMVPEFWSDTAVKIVAEKYFRVINGVKENSVKQMAHRVATTITNAGVEQGLLDPENAGVFYEELLYLIITQKMAFNSPVWFNIGVPGAKQQASACFIQDVTDDMRDIVDLVGKEMMLFKSGSGTGSNLSKLRSSREKLSGGGYASGPVSFMEVYDAGAGVTKSGGTTRRAAKMVILNHDHPDIMYQSNGRPGFILCKAAAEKMAHDLYSTGEYTAEFNAPNNVYEKVGFQNANNSVRVTDEFMVNAINGETYWTREVTTGNPVEELDASEVLDEIAKAAWFCGDPGLQYDTTINSWHTVPDSGRINGSNPCSEYMYLDDSACNLASLNLVAFDRDGEFQIDDFVHAVQITITAMEILVDYSEYPSEKIAQNSHRFRPLGLGYANLGALLMLKGLPYDSKEGRELAGAITSLLSGSAYAQSMRMAQAVGAFEGLDEGNNRAHMSRVIRKHADAAYHLRRTINSLSEAAVIADRACNYWDTTATCGAMYGWRNGQVTVMAPTGTISFMMDCDTTGVEPALGLVTYKKLVGGGMQPLFVRCVDKALENLGYNETERAELAEYIAREGDLEGAPLKERHKPVFQTAYGKQPLSVDAHLEMMAAIQPFVSGAISKTVNLPADSTVEDFREAFIKAWKLGLKAVALFREGCKLSQPINTKKTEASGAREQKDSLVAKSRDVTAWGDRRRLPDNRTSLTHKFSIAGQDGYLTIGFDPEGRPMEIFIRISKAGSTLAGLTDMMATMVSIALQHGAPIATIVDKLKGTSFEPAGITANPDIRFASSICDYIGRFLEKLNEEKLEPEPLVAVIPAEIVDLEADGKENAPVPAKVSGDGPPCSSCGNSTQRSGACYVCSTCGTTTGCG